MTALLIWANVIVPSVFPYLIISQYISNSQIAQRLPLGLISFVFGIKKCSTKAVLCSAFCGYPSGAVCAKELYKKGEIDIHEAQRLICYTNNAGPLFLISAVGTGLLRNTKDGGMIYIIQLLSSLLYGILSRRKTSLYAPKTHKTNLQKGDFCSYVKNAVNICINICGFMVAAYALSASVIIITNNLFKDFSNSFYINAFIKAFFEISAGINEISTFNSECFKFALICGAVSWSGFSVIMQIKSVSGEIIGLKKLCGAKFIQSAFSFFMGLLYKRYFCSFNPYSPKLISIPISIIAAILIFIRYLIHQKKLSENS